MEQLRTITRALWGTPRPSILSTLPVEILFIIAEFLSLENVARLRQTSHFLANTLEQYLYAHAATHKLPGRSRMVLDWAAEKGHVSILQKIDKYGNQNSGLNHHSSSTIPPKCKTRALSHAAKRGQTDAVSFLLRMGAEIDGTVAVEDSYQCTALHRAAKHGHIETATLLLDRGADIHIRCNASDSAALEHAARLGEREMVLLLLDRGADIHAPALVANAVFSENIDLVRALLDRGATIDDSWHYRRSAIHWTMPYGRVNMPMLKLLLARGIEPNVRDHERGETVLHWAAYEGNVETVGLLLANGANADIANHQGKRPLHTAIEGLIGQNDGGTIIRLLLEAGADPLSDGCPDGTPVGLARRLRAQSDIIGLLVSETKTMTGTMAYQ